MHTLPIDKGVIVCLTDLKVPRVVICDTHERWNEGKWRQNHKRVMTKSLLSKDLVMIVMRFPMGMVSLQPLPLQEQISIHIVAFGSVNGTSLYGTAAPGGQDMSSWYQSPYQAQSMKKAILC